MGFGGRLEGHKHFEYEAGLPERLQRLDKEADGQMIW
jgi:hypothetical protein